MSSLVLLFATSIVILSSAFFIESVIGYVSFDPFFILFLASTVLLMSGYISER